MNISINIDGKLVYETPKDDIDKRILDMEKKIARMEKILKKSSPE